jgi:hypothetical protein
LFLICAVLLLARASQAAPTEPRPLTPLSYGFGGSCGTSLVPCSAVQPLGMFFWLRNQIQVTHMQPRETALGSALDFSFEVARRVHVGAVLSGAMQSSEGRTVFLNGPAELRAAVRLGEPSPAFFRPDTAPRLSGLLGIRAAVLAPHYDGDPAFVGREAGRVLPTFYGAVELNLFDRRVQLAASPGLSFLGKFAQADLGARISVMLSDSLTLDAEGRRQQSLADADKRQNPGLCGSAWLGSVGLRAVGARGLFLGVRYVAGQGECVSPHAVHLDFGLGIGEGMRRIPTPDEVSWIRSWRALLLGMIDPVLDCQGIMLDDDGHPMFRFGQPDPSDPHTILRGGARWRVGDHFYTKGHHLYHQSDLHTPIEDLRSVQPLTAEEQAGSYECRIGPRRQPSVCAQVIEHIGQAGGGRARASAALPAVSALLEQSLKNTLSGSEALADKTEAAARVREVIERWGCEKVLTREQMAVLLASAEPVLAAHGLKLEEALPAPSRCVSRRQNFAEAIADMDPWHAMNFMNAADAPGGSILATSDTLTQALLCPDEVRTSGVPPWLGGLGKRGRPGLGLRPQRGQGSGEAVHTQPPGSTATGKSPSSEAAIHTQPAARPRGRLLGDEHAIADMNTNAKKGKYGALAEKEAIDHYTGQGKDIEKLPESGGRRPDFRVGDELIEVKGRDTPLDHRWARGALSNANDQIGGLGPDTRGTAELRLINQTANVGTGMVVGGATKVAGEVLLDGLRDAKKARRLLNAAESEENKRHHPGLPPNRGNGGRGGGPAHAHVQERLRQELKGDTEVPIDLPNGKRRIVDVKGEDGSLNQIGDMRNRGGTLRPSARERGAIEDLRKAEPDATIRFFDKRDQHPPLVNPDQQPNWPPAPSKHRKVPD